MPTFRNYYGLEPDFDFASLEFEHACRTSGVRSVANAFPEGAEEGVLNVPFGAALRFGEAADAIYGLTPSRTNQTSKEKATNVVCAISQLGGCVPPRSLAHCAFPTPRALSRRIIFSTLAVITVLLVSCIAPIGGALAAALYNLVVRRRERQVARSRYVDDRLESDKRVRAFEFAPPEAEHLIT